MVTLQVGKHQNDFRKKVMNDNNLIIKIENLSHAYGAQQKTIPIIENFSLDIQMGRVTVLIGPSGCGKSTLARLIAGFEKPDGGSILMHGKTVRGPSPERLVVFQESALFLWMSTLKNISFGPDSRGESSPGAENIVQKMLEKVGLNSFSKKFPSQLSGGMQRRAELARALVNGPKVMILDEPFRGLDAMSKALMQQHFIRLMANSLISCIFITSDIDEAVLLADQIVITTNKPLKVAAKFDVTIQKPRSTKKLVESDEANKLKFQALEVLHKEAMKSFASGSKAAEDFLRAYSIRNN